MDKKTNLPPIKVTNPVLPDGGFGADPELHRFKMKDGTYQYWIYCTNPGTNGLDAFCSMDNMASWQKVEKILDMSSFPYAKNAFWAPAVTEHNGKYYIAFTCNCVLPDTPRGVGGMGIGVSDTPGGPFVNVRSDKKPMIDHFVHKAQPIDGQFFTDDDGTDYFYFGTGEHCNVGILNDNFTGFKALDNSDRQDDDALFLHITPASSHERMQFYEGTFVIKRNGVYYLMYSTDGWDTYKYSVVYATSDSPFGPFIEQKKILETDLTFSNGPGHHSCLYLDDYDLWLICYHRRAMGTHFDTRLAAIDVMTFDENGVINDVYMTDTWTYDNGVLTVSPKPADHTSDLAMKPGAKAICKSEDAFYTASKVINGKLRFDQRWAQGDREAGQYIGVDFGKKTAFDKVVLRLEFIGDYETLDGEFELQISDDLENWNTVLTHRLTDEEKEGVYGVHTVTVDLPQKQTSRAVRAYFADEYVWLSVYEIEVYNSLQ